MIMRQHGKVFVCVCGAMKRFEHTMGESAPISIQHPLSADGKAKAEGCVAVAIYVCIWLPACVFMGNSHQ